eukprot:scaffold4352_cov131-Skeletonema_marinoi.AAC.5
MEEDERVQPEQLASHRTAGRSKEDEDVDCIAISSVSCMEQMMYGRLLLFACLSADDTLDALKAAKEVRGDKYQMTLHSTLYWIKYASRRGKLCQKPLRANE